MNLLYKPLHKGLPILVCLLLLSACAKENDNSNHELDSELEALLTSSSNGEGLSFFQFPSSDDFASIPQDPKNPITAEKVSLGKLLFHETGIAVNPKKPEGTGTYSCASCHHFKAGFQACRIQGVADGGLGFGISGESRVNHPTYLHGELDVQPIRTPSTLNVAYQKNMLWNGQFGATHLNEGTEAQWTEETPKAVNHLGFEGVETQAIAGMDVHRLAIKNSIAEMSETYRDLFEDAYPETSSEERFTIENAGKAIAAYERTLFANEAPFQQWLKGDFNALTDAQKRGAILFFGEAQCNSCHTGPALNSMEFHALGMNDLQGFGVYGNGPQEGDKQGRGGFTKQAEDMYKFKVPQLYNLKDSPFYGHGSSFNSVEDVVRYKNAALAENAEVPTSQLAAEFVPLSLNEQEILDLSNFIENALYDPNLQRYIPESLPSGNCFPNNDAMSKSDLGCE